MDDLARDTALLRGLVAFANLAPATLAKRAGVAPSTIQRPYSGTATTRLGRNVLEKLQAAFPDYEGWVEYASLGDKRLPFGGFPTANLPDVVEVAHIDLNFGLGPAFMDQDVVEYQAERLPFPRAWLRQITNSDIDQLYWTHGVGNSMEPAISDGDVILIDRSKVGSTFGDLYWAIAYGQAGMIKRLRPMPDGSIKILSDNPNVPPEVAYDGELHVFGRVVAVVKRI